MESLFLPLRTIHYYLMVLLLVFIVFTIGKFFFRKSSNIPFESMDDKNTLVVTILAHIQLLLGITLLMLSPLSEYFSHMGDAMGEKSIRMMLVEHPLTMIIGIILLTIGRAKMKRKTEDKDKFNTIIIFYSIALVLILSRIPWSNLHG